MSARINFEPAVLLGFLYENVKMHGIFAEV
jgi:hypothetical protein